MASTEDVEKERDPEDGLDLPAIPAALRARYRILRVLGRGSFGEVLLARDQELGRQVALKILHRAGRDPEMAARFEREARLTAELGHPHVLEIYDHGVDSEGGAWILYEYVEGRDLRRVLTSGERPAAAEVMLWGGQIASALSTAHRAGVVHRDVKPENVLLRTRGHALLADFGIAHLGPGGTALTAEGMILGTAPYVAPEVWRGEIPGPASDQFGWGVCLFECLSGRLPWEDASPSDILARARSGRPLKLSTALHRSHPGLARAIERAISFRPEQRFPDMEAFADRLRGLSSSGSGLPGGGEPTLELLETTPGEHPPVQVWRGTPTLVQGLAPAETPSVAPARAKLLVLLASVILLLGFSLRISPDRSSGPPPEVPVAAVPAIVDAERRTFESALEQLLWHHGESGGDLSRCVPVSFETESHLLPRLPRLADPRLPVRWRRFLDALVELDRRREGKDGDLAWQSQVDRLEQEAYLAFHLADDLKTARFASLVRLSSVDPARWAEHHGSITSNWEELKQTDLGPLLALPRGPLACRLAALHDMLDGLMDRRDGGRERILRARQRFSSGFECSGSALVLDSAAILLYPGYHPGAEDCAELRGLFELAVERFLEHRSGFDEVRDAEIAARLILGDVLVEACSEEQLRAFEPRTRELRVVGHGLVEKLPEIFEGILVDGAILQHLGSDAEGISGERARSFLAFQQRVRERSRMLAQE